MEFNCTSDILHRVSALPNEADFEADELSDDDDCDSAHGDEFDIDDENEEDDDNDSEECKSSDIDSDNEEDLQDLTSVDDPSSKVRFLKIDLIYFPKISDALLLTVDAGRARRIPQIHAIDVNFG